MVPVVIIMKLLDLQQQLLATYAEPWWLMPLHPAWRYWQGSQNDE